MLEEKELGLASRLAIILAEPKWDSGSLLVDILPKYWEDREDGSSYTLQPDGIYRTLYYVHSYGSLAHFEKFTRIFMDMLGSHLEACLYWLGDSQSLPLGSLTVRLHKEGILSAELAGLLLKFNKLVYVPAKHIYAVDDLPDDINERTFSIIEAALAFVMARKLSISLFELLKSKGVNFPQGWKEFKQEWLSWNIEIT
ncbi:MAG: hypothetical protein HRF40_05715 [Nitrososphaera sp.]